MEIVESTVENSKQQMNEIQTIPTSAECSSDGNMNANGVAGAPSTDPLAGETRTKDNTTAAVATSTTTGLSAAGSTDAMDMDIEIIEMPAKSSTVAELSTVDGQNQLPAKLTSPSTNTAVATVTQIDDDIPIISLSDGEDTAVQNAQSSLQKVCRKRNSVGVSTSEDDKHFRLKRRKIKVAGAPKMPLTGYVRYMNDRRELLRKELPSKTAIEHTKIIGEEWQKMTEERKAPYLKAAELDKQRYLDELHTFLKERPDVLACELAKNKARKSPGEAGKSVLKEKSQSSGNIKTSIKESNAVATTTKDKSQHGSEQDNSPPAASATSDSKNKRKRTPTPTNTHNSNNNHNSGTTATTATTSTNTSAIANNNNNSHNSTSSNNHNSNTTTTITTANSTTTSLATTVIPAEIPIFTNEFLEHNKIFDMELRTLRKSKTDLEQQNAVLEKHVENMKFGVEKMTNENDELAEKNRLLELYLDKLKSKLAHALAGLAIPSQPTGATIDNIDKYMGDLYKMATTNTHGPASLNKAKDIIRKLDLQINL